LLGLLFNLEDGDDMFHRNIIRLWTDYTVISQKHNSS
jgi:hypothetical protein